MEVLSNFELKRVLVPVDFSESSRKALRYALSLARPFNATIHLLHVVEAVVMAPDVEVVDPEAFAAALNEKAATSLNKWRQEAAAEAQVEEELRAGSPTYQQIVEAAREGNMDLIILGTQGRSGLAGVLIGSTAERVARQAPCPVLVVREPRQGSSAVG